MFYIQVTDSLQQAVNIFLGPPVSNCLRCSAALHTHHGTTRVICHTLLGPLPAQKITLRCKGSYSYVRKFCKFIMAITECCINYRYEMYGGEAMGGYRYYDHGRPFISASNICYIQRELCEQWLAAG